MNFRENFKNITCTVTCEGIYANVQLALLGEEEKREDKEKVSILMNQYNEFKRKILPNFRFNPEKETTYFGRYIDIQKLFKNLLLLLIFR